MNGRIVRLIKEKQFGFIREESGAKPANSREVREYFFHSSGLKNAKFDDLEIGMEVTFEDVDTERGPRAEDIYL